MQISHVCSCSFHFFASTGRVVSPDCNVPLRPYGSTVRRARKYKEALEDSANMSNHKMMQTSEEITENISRLRLRRLRSKRKQQHLAKKKQSILKAGHGQSTSSESSSSSSMSDSTKGDATLLFASTSLSQGTRRFKPRTGNATAQQSKRNMASPSQPLLHK